MSTTKVTMSFNPRLSENNLKEEKITNVLGKRLEAEHPDDLRAYPFVVVEFQHPNARNFKYKMYATAADQEAGRPGQSGEAEVEILA
ncbi:hypothetical protein MKEN_01446900 [Mycena kentingensis (nom. inval.)]|nr:hypothetical protein MKEN_01446900 [Mycena kentingensis (nom. inval.)]